MKSIIFTLFFLFLSLPAAAAETDSGSKPDSGNLPVYARPIRFFQTFVSNADGNRCTMYPSCSTYAIDAFKQKGAFMGWVMTCDRLMRCGGDEHKISPIIIKNNRRLIFDPVRNNEFK